MTEGAVSGKGEGEAIGTRALAAKLLVRLRPYRRQLVLAVALLVIAVPFVNFHPLVWGAVADGLLAGEMTPGLLAIWLAVMMGTYLVGIGLNALQSYLLEKTGQELVRDIRQELFARLEGQSLSFHRQSSSGDLVTRMTSDVDAMEQSVLQGLTNLLEEVVTFVVVAAMVLWISPLVGTLSILPLAIAFLFIRRYNQKVRSIYEGVRRRLGGIGSFLQDRLAGVQVTQSFARERGEQAAFGERADEFYRASVAASRMRNSYFPVVSAFGFVNNLVMLGVGAWLIMEGSELFTVGALLAYRGFWWRLQSPVRTIAQTSDIVQRARAAAARVIELLEVPVAIEDQPGATAWEGRRGELVFDRVSFGYEPGVPVLSELSFRVAAGEFVAVAGGSGSGKSTMLALISRFYDPDRGVVLVDGRDVRSMTLASLRGGMGVVGQDSYLFDGTVRENIAYGRPGASFEEIVEAAIEANAHGFIEGLARGYETRVGQSGLRLSGGQRQRLCLARALLTRPTILLLDEPTASVEPESEALIHESILRRRDRGEGTTVLVTHRSDLLTLVPRILYVEGGRLAGDGRHEDLVADCPGYVDAYHRWEQEGQRRGSGAGRG